MTNTVSIGGKHVNKWALYGGVGVVVVGGVLYFKNRKGASSPSSSAGQTGTDPVTNLPYSMDNQVDPATGLTYLAEATQYGSVQAAESAVSGGYGTGVTGTGYGYSGLGYGYPSSSGYSGTAGPTGVSYPDNASWAQAVEAGLTGLGYTSTDVAAAIGRYLARLNLTAAQASIVQAGVAEYGPPPVGSFQIIQAPSSPPPPTGGGGGGGDGEGGGGSGGGGTTPSAPAWLSSQWVNRTQANVHWAPVTGASHYRVSVTYQSQGVQTHTTAQQNMTISGLTPNHTYGIHVAAVSSSGHTSAETSTSIHTPK